MARVSLVELMVALLILTVGVLGLAATADSAGRAVERARRMSQSVAQARVTIDSLKGRACRVAVREGGTAPGQSWAVRAANNGVRYLMDSVRVTGPGATRRFTVEGVALCP
jgi:Tfp pilus assembly protein PilV